MTTKNTEPENSDQSTGFLSYLVDTSKPFDIEGVPLKLYVLIALLSIVTLKLGQLNNAGVAGAFAVLWTIGFFFFAIGERIRILKAVLGGGLVVAYAGAAIVAHSGLISAAEIQYLQAPIIDNRFLYLVLATLLISSIISVPSSVLKKALLSYAPIVGGGLALSAIGGIVAGILVGVPLERVVTMYFLPIMGGGTGAGAIPMSEVYSDVTGESATEYFNYAIAVLTLGNIVAILVASSLRRLGQRFPVLSGDGKLVRGADQELIKDEILEKDDINTHAALFLIVCILLAGVILSTLIGLIHLFAWVTIIAVLLNVAKVVPSAMQVSLRLLNAWSMRAFLVTILVAFGLSADIDVISTLFTLSNLFIIVSIVVGAALGAGITAQLVNCYPIEGAVSGGLCMANAGGSGDLQVLSAAGRLELFPYAQISSRLGGAFMLVLANYLFGLFV